MKKKQEKNPAHNNNSSLAHKEEGKAEPLLQNVSFLYVRVWGTCICEGTFKHELFLLQLEVAQLSIMFNISFFCIYKLGLQYYTTSEVFSR